MLKENDFNYVDLRIEVKCSRRGKFKINERDMQGLQSDQKTSFGFLATLITSNLQQGPHWALIPAHQLSPRSYSEKLLHPLRTEVEFWKRIDYLWGEVLLNQELIDKLLGMRKIDFKSMDWWNQLPFREKTSPHDAIRKIKLYEALHQLRQALDEKYNGYGARREGFLHQCILCFCLLKSGFETVSNISGVPDLRTQILIGKIG